MRIGVLALQGAFVEHMAVLRQLGAEGVAVRLPQEMEGLQGLILPGGESTTMSTLMAIWGFPQAIRALAEKGMPLWGTCAGLILLAQRVVGNHRVAPLGLMDLTVRRNAFGRQVDSFEADLSIPVLGPQPFPAVFIRAPLIEGWGEGVEVLAHLPEGPAVAARQGSLLVTAFHPELTSDLRFHGYFLELATKADLREGRS